MFVTSGGCTIVGQPISVYTSTDDNLEVAQFISKSPDNLNSSFSVLKVSSASTSSSHFLLTASNQGSVRFSVQANGKTNIQSGGLSVTGGLTVENSGIEVMGM